MMEMIKYRGFEIRSIPKGKYALWVAEMPGTLSVASKDISKVMRAIDNYLNPYLTEQEPTEIEEEQTKPI
jgi:hypothetical protein